MKPTQDQVMAAYLADMQRELAQGEKLKQQTEAMRTENWSLEKRNSELKTNIASTEAREKNLKAIEAEYLKNAEILDKKEKAFKNEQNEFYQRQIKLADDIKKYDEFKAELGKRIKNFSDKEKAIEAREYEVEIDKGKLEQKLKAYRDKLSL